MSSAIKFAVNLRPDTFDAQFLGALRPWGHLAAPDNLTRALARELVAARQQRRSRVFVADNGNFTLIGKVRGALQARAAVLRRQLDTLEARLGRNARRADLGAAQAVQWQALADDVLAAAEAAQAARPDPTPRQLALRPTHLIGAEHIGMACLLALDVERDLLPWPRTRWRALNREVARAAAAAAPGLPAGVAAYGVASGVDYDTGFDAGVEFARAGATHVAMGFGAYMADNHSIDQLRFGRRTQALGERLPARYLRTAAVARGFWDGYARQRPLRDLQAFHFLGLGQPLLMGLVAIVGRDTPMLSFDAMSPIKDAVEGTLYVNKPAQLKVRTRKVADRMSRDPDVRWDCPCASCRAFLAEYPLDQAAARAWRAAHPLQAVGAAVLAPGGALFDALPLFSEPRAGPLRAAVNRARMGHNHWVLQTQCRQLQARSRSGRLPGFVQTQIEAYAAATAAPRNARAIRLGLEIALRAP